MWPRPKTFWETVASDGPTELPPTDLASSARREAQSDLDEWTKVQFMAAIQRMTRRYQLIVLRQPMNGPDLPGARTDGLFSSFAGAKEHRQSRHPTGRALHALLSAASTSSCGKAAMLLDGSRGPFPSRQGRDHLFREELKVVKLLEARKEGDAQVKAQFGEPGILVTDG